MASVPEDGSRSFRSPSSSPTVFRPASSSLSSYFSSSNSPRPLSAKRFSLLILTFVLGTVFVVIMKREQWLWLLASTAGASPVMQWGQGNDFQGLRFNQDGTFKISVFEDLHFGEPADWDRGGPKADLKTAEIMGTILDASRPNLAVLNGDILTGEYVASVDVRGLISQVVEPLLNRSIPWASTYGNHDMSKTVSTSVIADSERDVGGKLAWVKSMVQSDNSTAGVSNYFVPIYESGRGGNPNLAMLLWFFDSRGGKMYQQVADNGDNVEVADYVDQKVIDWFNLEKQALAQQYGRVIPSLAFVHIPIHAMFAFQHDGKFHSTLEPGLNEDDVGHQGVSCEEPGRSCSWNKKDTPFMQSLASTEGLMAVFSGHVHGDDWCMKWSDLLDNEPVNGNNIHLCFGRHSGYGGYSNWMRGARQIVLHEENLGKKEIETWIQLEDGKISGHVTLNQTYGTDEYTPVDKTESPPLETPESRPGT